MKADTTERFLHPYGDRELYIAKGDDWSFPLYVDWRVDKENDVHYAHILPAFCPYRSQGLALIALLGPHDVLGRTDFQWVIPRRMAEALLHKAPGITPKYYYSWPGQPGPLAAPLNVVRADVKRTQPRPPVDETFAQYVARTRSISSSIINAVMNAISEEAPGWMIGQRRAVDLGFCRLLAVPFRANWKEIVTFKARSKGIKLRSLFKLRKGARTKALVEAGLPELLCSPHNIGLRRGWKNAGGSSQCLDYCIEAVPTDKFNYAVSNIESGRQSQGSTAYVGYYEQSVELLYKDLVSALAAFVRKVAAPFAHVCEGGRIGHIRFLPISGRKIRVRDKTLGNYPQHIVAPDSGFSVFGQESDPRLIRAPVAEVPALPAVLQEAVDVRERSVEGHLELENGEGADGVPVLDVGKGGDAWKPMLPGAESAGDGLDETGDSGI